MKIFEIYTKSNATNYSPEIESVKTGFSFYAFIFSSFWALYHKIWYLFFGLLLVEGFVFYQIYNSPEDSFFLRILSLLINLWVGFEAANFRGKNLIKKGFGLTDISIAKDEISAEQRFLDRSFGLPASV
ncbi:MAG: DUF2628 domain-containing protein [Rickettsiales bacterium]|nr:DUF2628 domain-containing protein [Rickettsiales bacterium]